ncbi:MAG: adenosine deaminase [Motiliproteus sp.]|jgi:adenosine deaminase
MWGEGLSLLARSSHRRTKVRPTSLTHRDTLSDALTFYYKDFQMKNFIAKLPKIELHLHIEGTLEPQMMLDLSQKNKIKLPYKNIQEIQNAYQFEDLQSFLDLYYAGASVLRTQQDFFDLTWAYMRKCKEENIIHTEIFFDPQTHTMREIPIREVIGGITRALQKAKQELGISSYLIACILRHLSQEEGLEILQELLPYKKDIVAIGLDSAEKGNPPSKFKELFAKARQEGFLLVAHAGEEGDAGYIQEALDLGVARIDHGVGCEEDDDLVAYLKEQQIPLTICPLSNQCLKVVPTMKDHNLLRLLNRGLCVTINSDDPAYFGGYMNANMLSITRGLGLVQEDLERLSFNALQASFLAIEEKTRLKEVFEKFFAGYKK